MLLSSLSLSPDNGNLANRSFLQHMHRNMNNIQSPTNLRKSLTIFGVVHSVCGWGNGVLHQLHLYPIYIPTDCCRRVNPVSWLERSMAPYTLRILVAALDLWFQLLLCLLTTVCSSHSRRWFWKPAYLHLLPWLSLTATSIFSDSPLFSPETNMSVFMRSLSILQF